MAKARTPIPLAPALTRTLDSVRGWLRLHVIAQMVLRTICWLICVFWVGGLLDYLPVRVGSSETPTWVRIGLLVFMAAGSLWIVFGWGLPRLFAELKPSSIALLIEKHFPQLNNELVTAVELSDLDAGPADVSDPVAHRKMLERVHLSLWGKIGHVDPRALFNWQPLWRLGTAAAAGVLLTAMVAWAEPQGIGLWARRLFTLSEETWPRQAALRADGVQLRLPSFTGELSVERILVPFEDEVARIPQGAAAVLKISAEAEEKVVPERCTLFYRSEDGGRGRANLRRVGRPQDGWQQFVLDGPPLDGIVANMELDVVGLDARLRNLKLRTVPSTVISNMAIACRYPLYLQATASGDVNPVQRPPEELLPYRIGAQIPEGTHITLVGEANAPLSLVEYVVRQQDDSARDADSAPEGVPKADSPIEIQSVQPRGKKFEIELGTLRGNSIVEVRLRDQFGLSGDQIPRYVLNVQEDSPPEVETQLVGIGSSITPEAILPFTGRITDDNAIAKIQLELARSEDRQLSVDLGLTGGDELEQTVDLNVLAEKHGFQVEPGESLGLVVTAWDFYNLNGQEHVGRGQPQLLSVVTEDQLLVLLDRQELELRQRIERIMTELQDMREVLLQLADLQTDPQLTDAGNRKKLISLQDDSQEQRMLLFRAQQCVLQGDKSEQELLGVADRVENVRLQLQNNRIDSYDRQARLREKVFIPLETLLKAEYADLSRALSETQSATRSGDGSRPAQQAISSVDAVLASLESIRDNMLDIESFNEIIDLVRGLLEEQDKLIEETEQAQKARILDLLK